MECLECGKEFKSVYPSAKFCNPDCCRKSHNRKWRLKKAEISGKQIAHRKDKNCEFCGILMKDCLPHKKYCNKNCKNKAKYLEHPRNTNHEQVVKINNNATGAMNEMLVCADLLRRGHSVFRSISPSCSCDLIILKEKNIIRVEVTTGFMTSKDKFFMPQKDSSKFDLLAIVFHNGDIIYDPKF